MSKYSLIGTLTGAAFLMATSAIGPGFLTQTSVFTEQLKSAFAFAIFISIIIDIIVQLNIWLILSVSKMRAQDVANKALPYSGYFIATLIVIGGLVFNIGNIGGAAMGINVISGINLTYGAILSSLIAIIIFLQKEMGRAMDHFTRILGLAMIFLVLLVLFKTKPPVVLAAKEMIMPSQIDLLIILTLVGGTVGGYISFAGAHRIIDAGITGIDNVKHIRRGAINAVIITGVMRCLLFLAILGVVYMGHKLDPANPPASAFRLGAGEMGYRMFGVILWCAGITSAVGASYTSVSFIRTFSKFLDKNNKYIIILFIIISTLIFITIGKPVKLLIFAGSLNALVLPIALFAILLGAYKKKIIGNYNHPKWLAVLGYLVAFSTLLMGIKVFSRIFTILS